MAPTPNFESWRARASRARRDEIEQDERQAADLLAQVERRSFRIGITCGVEISRDKKSRPDDDARFASLNMAGKLRASMEDDVLINTLDDSGIELLACQDTGLDDGKMTLMAKRLERSDWRIVFYGKCGSEAEGGGVALLLRREWADRIDQSKGHGVTRWSDSANSEQSKGRLMSMSIRAAGDNFAGIRVVCAYFPSGLESAPPRGAKMKLAREMAAQVIKERDLALHEGSSLVLMADINETAERHRDRKIIEADGSLSSHSPRAGKIHTILAEYGLLVDAQRAVLAGRSPASPLELMTFSKGTGPKTQARKPAPAMNAPRAIRNPDGGLRARVNLRNEYDVAGEPRTGAIGISMECVERAEPLPGGGRAYARVTSVNDRAARLGFKVGDVPFSARRSPDPRQPGGLALCGQFRDGSTGHAPDNKRVPDGVARFRSGTFQVDEEPGLEAINAAVQYDDWTFTPRTAGKLNRARFLARVLRALSTSATCVGWECGEQWESPRAGAAALPSGRSCRCANDNPRAKLRHGPQCVVGCVGEPSFLCEVWVSRPPPAALGPYPSWDDEDARLAWLREAAALDPSLMTTCAGLPSAESAPALRPPTPPPSGRTAVSRIDYVYMTKNIAASVTGFGVDGSNEDAPRLFGPDVSDHKMIVFSLDLRKAGLGVRSRHHLDQKRMKTPLVKRVGPASHLALRKAISSQIGLTLALRAGEMEAGRAKADAARASLAVVTAAHDDAKRIIRSARRLADVTQSMRDNAAATAAAVDTAQAMLTAVCDELSALADAAGAEFSKEIIRISNAALGTGGGPGRRRRAGETSVSHALRRLSRQLRRTRAWADRAAALRREDGAPQPNVARAALLRQILVKMTTVKSSSGDRPLEDIAKWLRPAPTCAEQLVGWASSLVEAEREVCKRRRANIAAVRRFLARKRRLHTLSRTMPSVGKKTFDEIVHGKSSQSASTILLVDGPPRELVTGERLVSASHKHFAKAFGSAAPMEPSLEVDAASEPPPVTEMGPEPHEIPDWVDSVLPSDGLSHVKTSWWSGMMKYLAPGAVTELLFGSKAHKAAGSDGITNALVRLCVGANKRWSQQDREALAVAEAKLDLRGHSSVTELFLTEWLNTMLATDTMSRSQRHGIVNLIPKGDAKVVTSLSQSRPLTLMCLPGKMLATILAQRLSNVLERNPILCGAQQGFRRGKSCGSAIGPVQDALEDAREFRAPLYAVACDRKAAFDRVETWVIIRALKSIKAPARFIDTVRSMYTDVRSRARTSCGLTEEFAVTRGVKQGCPLSPLLYIVSENSLHHVLLNNPIARNRESAKNAARRRFKQRRSHLAEMAAAASLAASEASVAGAGPAEIRALQDKALMYRGRWAKTRRSDYKAFTVSDDSSSLGYTFHSGSRPVLTSRGYADDVLITSSSRAHIQAQLHLMSDWLYYQNQSCVARKSWCFAPHASKGHSREPLDLSGGQVRIVPNNEAVRYLGVWLRSDGHTSGHAERALVKARQQAATLAASGARGFEALAAARQVIVPGIAYGGGYMALADSNVKKLAATYRGAVKNSFGLPSGLDNRLAASILGLPVLRDELDKAFVVDCLDRLGGDGIATRTARARLSALASRCGCPFPLAAPKRAAVVPPLVNRLAYLATVLARNDMQISASPFDTLQLASNSDLPSALGSHMLPSPSLATHRAAGHDRCLFDQAQRFSATAAAGVGGRKAAADRLAWRLGYDRGHAASVRLVSVDGRRLLCLKQCRASLRSRAKTQREWHETLRKTVTPDGSAELGGALLPQFVDTAALPPADDLLQMSMRGSGDAQSGRRAVRVGDFVIRSDDARCNAASIWRVRGLTDPSGTTLRLEEWTGGFADGSAIWRPLRCAGSSGPSAASRPRCDAPAVARPPTDEGEQLLQCDACFAADAPRQRRRRAALQLARAHWPTAAATASTRVLTLKLDNTSRRVSGSITKLVARATSSQNRGGCRAFALGVRGLVADYCGCGAPHNASSARCALCDVSVCSNCAGAGLSLAQARCCVTSQPPRPSLDTPNCAACADKLDPRLAMLPLLLESRQSTSRPGLGGRISSNLLQHGGGYWLQSGRNSSRLLGPLGGDGGSEPPTPAAGVPNGECRVEDLSLGNFEYGFRKMRLASGAWYPIFFYDPRTEVAALWGADIPSEDVTIATDGSYVAERNACSAGFAIQTPRTCSEDVTGGGCKGAEDRYDLAQAVLSGARLAGGDSNYLAELTALLMAILAVPVSANLTIVYDCTGAIGSTAGKPLMVDTGVLRDPADVCNGLRDSVLRTLRTPNHAVVNCIRRLLRLRANGGGSIRFVHQKSHTVPELLAAGRDIPMYAMLNGLADAVCDVAMSASSMGAPAPGQRPPRGAVHSWGGRAVSVLAGGALIRGNLRNSMTKWQLQRRLSRASEAPRQGASLRSSDDKAGDLKRWGLLAKPSASRRGDLTLLKSHLGLIWSARRSNMYDPSVSGGREDCSSCVGSWTGANPRDDSDHARAGCPAGLPTLLELERRVCALISEHSPSAAARVRDAQAAIRKDEATWSGGFWQPSAIGAAVRRKLLHGESSPAVPARAAGSKLHLGCRGKNEVVLHRARLHLLITRAQLAFVAKGSPPPPSVEAAAQVSADAIAKAYKTYTAPTPEVVRHGLCAAPAEPAMQAAAIQSFLITDVECDPFDGPLDAPTWRSRGSKRYEELLVAPAHEEASTLYGRNTMRACVEINDQKEFDDYLSFLHGADESFQKRLPTRTVASLRMYEDVATALIRRYADGELDGQNLTLVAAWTEGGAPVRVRVTLVLASEHSLLVDPVDNTAWDTAARGALDLVRRTTGKRRLIAQLAQRVKQPQLTRGATWARGWPAPGALAKRLLRDERARAPSPRTSPGPPRLGRLMPSLFGFGVEHAPVALAELGVDAEAEILLAAKTEDADSHAAANGFAQLQSCRQAPAVATAGMAIVPASLSRAIAEITSAPDLLVKDLQKKIVGLVEEFHLIRFHGTASRWEADRRNAEERAEAATQPPARPPLADCVRSTRPPADDEADCDDAVIHVVDTTTRHAARRYVTGAPPLRLAHELANPAPSRAAAAKTHPELDGSNAQAAQLCPTGLTTARGVSSTSETPAAATAAADVAIQSATCRKDPAWSSEHTGPLEAEGRFGEIRRYQSMVFGYGDVQRRE